MGSKVDIQDFAQFKWIWDHNGRDPNGGKEPFTIQDALASPNAPMWFPKVISNIVKEAQEPLLVGTSLLQRINYSYGQNITFPSVGALNAADIGEMEEYPVRSLNMGGSTVTANIGKSGLAVQVTEEMVRFSQFDVIGMHLRAAGRALARHKETKIFNYIRSIGIPVFNNLEPNKSVLGVTTGRDLQGQANGAMTMDDLFDGWAQIVTHGFMPNTLLMHPLTWTMFVKDAQMRAFVQQNGGGTFFATWTGNPAGRAPWDASSQGGLGVSSGQRVLPGQTSTGATAPHGQTASEAIDFSQIMNSGPVLPSYLGMPLTIIVSPFVPFDAHRKLTDVYLFDRNELGVLVVDHDVMTDEFEDPARDLKKIKLKERYGIGILNEGLGVSVFKNIHVVPNEVVLPAQAQINVTGPIEKIDPFSNLNL